MKRFADGGRIIRTSVTISPILAADGTVVGSTAVERDITQAHRTAAAKRAMQAEQAEVRRLTALEKLRKTFINEAAHELNTPLTPVLLHLHRLAADPNLTPDQRQHLSVIERNVGRLTSLVHDMLDASRLETGKLSLELDGVSLANLVEDTVEGLNEKATAHGITLSTGHLEPVVAMADATRLMQVLQNLVANAISFTRSGGHVTVSTTSEDGTAFVRVTDTGRGLSPEEIEELFQPFARPHEDTGAASKGTGLGLFISRGIIEQHRGKIWAESPGPGKGSTFCFSIPIAGPRQDTTPAPPATPRKSRGNLGTGSTRAPTVRSDPSPSKAQARSEEDIETWGGDGGRAGGRTTQVVSAYGTTRWSRSMRISTTIRFPRGSADGEAWVSDVQASGRGVTAAARPVPSPTSQ